MPKEKLDPPGSTARIVCVFSTSWRFKGKLEPGEGTPNRLGKLKTSYEQNRVQLPQLLPDRVLAKELETAKVALVGDVDGVTILQTGIELFRLPTNQVVLAVTLWIHGGAMSSGEAAAPIAEVLERCVAARLTVNGTDIEDAVPTMLGETVGEMFERERLNDEPLPSLLPERHQLVFGLGPIPPRARAVWETIIYRDEPPSRPEFVLRLRRPRQLNTNGGVGVVTPYISLLYGQETYVDASILLSTVHAVGTSARFRYIWRQAYDQVLKFREQKQRAMSGQQTRSDLEELADNLGNLEFDLTFSVEFPLMRVETFQSQLYDAMDLDRQASTLSQMFKQLGGSLKSEITAIEVREQRDAEARQKWNSVAAGLLSLVGVAVGFVIAFLGINTNEVPDPKVSMWDSTFKHLYLTAALFALTPVYLIFFPYLKAYVKKHGRERRAVGIWSMSVGVALFVFGCIADISLTDSRAIFAAIGMALGFFVFAVGVTLTIIRTWWLRKLDEHERQAQGLTTSPALPAPSPPTTDRVR